MIRTEDAYLAGIVDGDGCIHVTGAEHGHYLVVYAAFRNGSIDPLIDFLNHYGNCSYSKAKRVIQWNAYGERGLSVLRTIRPYLVHKQRTADVVLENYSTDNRHGREAAWEASRKITNALRDAPPSVDKYVGSQTAVTPEDAAYAAGFFDSEGCVYIAHGRTKKLMGTGKPRCSPYSLAVSVAQGDCRPLVWLADRFGGNVYRRNKTCCRSGYFHVWSLNGQKALNFLRAVAPHVILKKSEVDLVLGQWSFAGNDGGLDYLAENRALRARRDSMKSALRDLKKAHRGAAAYCRLGNEEQDRDTPPETQEGSVRMTPEPGASLTSWSAPCPCGP